ncbi:helix-turn-helix domain-containing protein [Leuconostoc pseudomesenteroides]|uniref:helix-turn-helix domain-containing protein n=1 Tax=Leuconostoc pseudomesenteroides TaxID=33968 RepID=UPI00111EA1A5|nr:helix-turn-helix transcriptional regulator [Leuconostoc pseudomesenteroides]TOZ06291.1 XRE family transcriptional regulator [Leuconostoc pseudomesenteroides]
MNRLRDLRKESGLKISELSNELNLVGADAIGKYERGEREPNINRLIMIADYFHVSIDYLVGRSDVR